MNKTDGQVQWNNIDQIPIGTSVTYDHTFTDEDLDLFIKKLVSDARIHVDDEWTRRETGFSRRVVHGVLTATLVSRAITKLCFEILQVNGIIHATRQKFVGPVYTGDKLTVTLKVNRIMRDENRMLCDTQVVNDRGETVMVGELEEYIIPPAKC